MRRVSLLAAVCVVVLAACGGGGGNAAKGPSVSVQTLRVAAQNSQAATSTRTVMTIDMRVDGTPVSIRAEGVASADGRNLQMTMDVPNAGTMEIRVVDGMYYMDVSMLPGAEDELPPGTRWIALDFDGLLQEGGVDMGALRDQANQGTASQGLGYLRGISGEVIEVGPEVVNGAPATHYRATIDYGKLADQFSAVYDDELRADMSRFGEVPAEVWIDAQDRVVKMRLELPGRAFDAGTHSVVMTMEITGFDVPVNVVAPPPDQVADISDLITEGFHDVGEPLSSV